ncbi:hypothetical protein PM082_015164 [Marasmius tenuissimus]|nr:hypothetical protein PM082_015164 [Marasmius tenuissimus]
MENGIEVFVVTKLAMSSIRQDYCDLFASYLMPASTLFSLVWLWVASWKRNVDDRKLTGRPAATLVIIMSTHFSNAQGWTIGAHANFQAVAGNSTIIHNHHSSAREDRVTLHGRTVRRIIDGDINFQRVLSSEILSVKFKPEVESTSTESQVVKVKRMEQTAEIYGYQGRFTATSFEPVDEKDQEKFKEGSLGVWVE